MTSCIDPSVGKYVSSPEEITDPELRGALTNHLKECEYCQLLTQRYQNFVELARHESGNHLSFEEIVSFIDEPSALSAHQKARIETHLSVCHYCQNLTAQVPSLSDLVNTFNTAAQLPPAAGWDEAREQELLRRIEKTVNSPKDFTVSRNRGAIPRVQSVTGRIRQIGANYRGKGTGEGFGRRLRLPTFLYVTLLVVLSGGALFYFFWPKGSNITEISQAPQRDQQSSPSSSAVPTPELRTTTAHVPVPSPMMTPSPGLKPPIFDSQDVATVIDPSRAAEPRQRIILKHSYLRFSVILKGSSGSSSYRVELIDEQTGRALPDSKITSAQRIRLQHKFVLIVEARELVNGFYTLRVTGMDNSGNTNEVFTSYFELVR